MNLVLIGYRGAGKTTVARRLALELGWDWVDADVEVERRAGKSISAIFADEGESHFRDLEAQTIAELAARERLVIAAGGGAVLRESNRRLLAECGRVVWLRASPEMLMRRIASCATTADRRPNLTAMGGEAEVRRLLAERAPLYEQCAQAMIDTDEKSSAEIAGEIIQRFFSSTREPV